jgi:hypothetical protein
MSMLTLTRPFPLLPVRTHPPAKSAPPCAPPQHTRPTPILHVDPSLFGHLGGSANEPR